jgi:BolA protein
MRVAERLARLLEEALSPAALRIVDLSAAHAGHAGARPGGESHFRVEITAAAFAGRSRLERQRLVLAVAAPLLRDEIHALSIAARAPGERAAGHAGPELAG